MVPLGPAFTGRLGGVFALAGGALYLLLSPERGPWWVAGLSLVVGIGLVPDDHHHRHHPVVGGVEPAWYRYRHEHAMRILGNPWVLLSSAGCSTWRSRAVLRVPAAAGRRGRAAGDPGRIEELLTPGASGVVDDTVRSLLAGGLHAAYVGVFATGVVVFLLSFLLPRGRRL